MNVSNFPSGRLAKMLGEHARQNSVLHQQFLRLRQNSLQNLRALIEMQIAGNFPEQGQAQPAVRQALFDSHQLDEFGVGQIANCLGPDFAHYADRRIPRIPNGDLKMMSRIVAISGARRDFSQPASITAEYDVPQDSWYFRDNAYPEIPVSLYMEIALQPCGFLSAYLDTYAFVPYRDFFFRNLDGEMRVNHPMDVRGKTITTQARMLNSVSGGGTVIQKFAFVLSCEGRELYTGESTFGYFSTETMANQVGLDGNRTVLPAMHSEPGLAQSAAKINLGALERADQGRPHFHLSAGRLHFIDDLFFAEDRGSFGQGYLYATRQIDPQDWFFPYHFYQDPVMPGSLGVEAILEAMQAGALHTGLGSELKTPRFCASVPSTSLSWRYRGQITRQHQLMELEVHLNAPERLAGQLILRGDASLWVDGLRIYEVKNAAVGIQEA